MFQTTSPEAVTTYASDCSTPKTAFDLGDTVCVQVSGISFLSVIPRRVALVDAAGNVRQLDTITSDGQTFRYVLPSTQTTPSGTSGDVFDNRGQWRLNIVPGSRLSVRTSAFFNVSDPAARVANLVIYNSDNVGGTTTVGTNGTSVTFVLWATNRGPDTASNVQITNPAPAGTTFVSAGQDSGTAQYTCSSAGDGTATCTAASVAPGQSARFSLVYQIVGGTAAGTVISDTARISSDTTELNSADNSETASVAVISGAAAACSINCPGDITTPATTTVNGVRGAYVTFAPEASGDCGTITSSPASGSFFPVGQTPVSVSSSGGGCSFNINVTDDTPPSINAPDDKTVTAADGACDATVDPGTPTTTPAGLDYVGVRDDGKALTDPYPGGTTTITWTATDAQGRTATDTQTITVITNDTTPPTITAPADITVDTGQDAVLCAVVIGDGSLGTPDADDNCSTVKVTRSGIPAGNLFPKGTTTITYTATDGAGNKATATQKVTVIDNTAPVIFAPADASYTCLTDVPAASPSQAGGPQLDVNGVPVRDVNGDLVPGGQPYDNCGAPVVTVSDSSTGAGTAANPKVITRTYTATDGSGNTASAAQTITVIDPTPPTVNVPADITVTLPANTTATSMPVTFSVTASDNCSGVTLNVSPASGSTFSVGTTTVTATATDAVGNVTTRTFKVTVLYNFAGFFSPVANPPTYNVVNAGLAVPMKFSLSGYKGSNIFLAGFPVSQLIPCDANAPVADVTSTVTAGGSSLNYDSSTDQYNYVWKTDSSWAGTCRQFVLGLNDGSTRVANFKFR